MATKPKKNARYDLNAADRRRNLLIQIGLTAIVVLVGVGLVLYIVTSADKKPAAGEAQSIRVTSSKLVTKEGSSDPKAVVSLYEDFLCPHCGDFEQKFGPTINQLIDSGAIAADYYMVAILDSPSTQNYSSRAAGAAYCVADESKDAFRRFHAALYAQQPGETGGSFPDDSRLVEVARQAGAGGTVADCINKGKYVPMVQGLAAATGIQSTPTIKINGEEFAITEATKPDGVGGQGQGDRRRCPRPDDRARCAQSDAAGWGRTVTVTADSPAEASTEQDRPGVEVRTASALWVLIAGALGLAAALTLTIEKIEILINPDYVPSCSINPVLSCGSVMVTPQASAFGFPNPLIGIVAFTIVVVTGVLAVAKVRLPRWYWAGLAAGTLLGVAFIHWLIFQSLYRIGALCPYCMVVWAVTIPLLVVVSSIALQPRLESGPARFIYQWRWSLVTLWFTALILMILVRFWNYWSTLI